MSIKAKPKKKRGRPATGRDPMMGFRAAPVLREADLRSGIEERQFVTVQVVGAVLSSEGQGCALRWDRIAVGLVALFETNS